ncbi:hypothetical protein SHKM778_46130 [Streptomyces sp. KM77-8]|uniref:Aminotransferase class I/classII large domain-containing protein n=1 Tax=Streptomyces haneummycinicus TaxID=3074435 RepID=A0AAT9HLA1_9ACTN
MAAAINPKTRAVFLCEPNNPTGTAVGTAELKRFLDRVPCDVLVVLDEAYFEFYRSPKAPDGVELHRARPNLSALRTFSKAYGLAGLRVGYGVLQPAIAEALRKCAVPCGVGRIAEEAACASLRVEAELFERVERIVAERNGPARRSSGSAGRCCPVRPTSCGCRRARPRRRWRRSGNGAACWSGPSRAAACG